MPGSGADDPHPADSDLAVRRGEAPGALAEPARPVSVDGPAPGGPGRCHGQRRDADAASPPPCRLSRQDLNEDFATWFGDVGSDLLLRCAHSVCGRQLYEDIAFEAAGKIYEQWADARKRQLFKTHHGYVFQVVRYAFLSYRRKAANRPELHHELPGEQDSGFWDKAAGDSGFEVRQALLLLDDEKAELIFIRYFLNLTLSATAREMGLKRGEADKIHRKALAELREILGPEGAG